MRMKNTISLIAAVGFLIGPLGQAVELSTEIIIPRARLHSRVQEGDGCLCATLFVNL